MLALDALIIQTIALEANSEHVVGAHHLKTILAMPEYRVSRIISFILPFLTLSEKHNVYIKIHTLALLEERELPLWASMFCNIKT